MGNIEQLVGLSTRSNEELERLEMRVHDDDIDDDNELEMMLNAVYTAKILIRHRMGTGFDGMRGLKIVDVGCGGDGPDLCPPYFCILAGMYGAEVVGIDLFPYTGEGREKYTHIESSLLERSRNEGKIDIAAITGVSAFDVVVCTGLTGDLPSPTLEGLIEARGLEGFMPIFIEYLREAAKRVLEPNGFFLFNGDVIDRQDL